MSSGIILLAMRESMRKLSESKLDHKLESKQETISDKTTKQNNIMSFINDVLNRKVDINNIDLYEI